MTTSEIGKLEPVRVREIWPDEAQDFTPWLAKNLHLLGQAIELELTLLDREVPGWSGRLDILAKTRDGAKVAIENQYGESDSDHFTRLIDYAANHDARVLVWVAEKFSEYHLRKIAWLNKVMASNAEIHAVAVRIKPGVELPRRGSDEADPGDYADFASVDLHKHEPAWAVRKSGEPSPEELFFQPLIKELQSRRFPLKPGRRDGHWQHFESGFRGVTYLAIIGKESAFVTLWISMSRGERVRVYDALCEYQAELENKLRDRDLKFALINRKYSIGMVRSGSLPSSDGKLLDSSDSELEKIRQWMIDNLSALEKAIRPRLEAVMQKLREPSP